MILRSETAISKAFEILNSAQKIGCDTETSSLSARRGRIFSIQFSDGENSFLVPLSEGVNLGKLSQILEDQQIIKVFHNAKFDLEFLKENGFDVQNVFDTMIAEKILTRGASQSVSLAETLYRYFAVDLDKSQRAKFNKNWDGIWTEELTNYALADVIYLPQLYKEQSDWLKKLGLEKDFAAAIHRIAF